MPPLSDSSLLLSVPVRRLEAASPVDVDLELKFDWEDYAILSDDRPLIEEIREASIGLERIKSVHLPPGTRTRGREIGMAATEANFGNIVDFVYHQLTDLPDIFIVMHPPRQFDYGDQLTLLNNLCDLTGYEITIENPPDESYWYTPEDIAFFGFVGATYSEWKDLYVTIDSAHLPATRSLSNPVDDDALAALISRLEGLQGLDLISLEKAYYDHLTKNVAKFNLEGIDQFVEDDWTPLLNTLLLTADRTKSVHFNDPAEDGIPDLADHHGDPVLDAFRKIVRTEGVYIVLEPDRETFDRPRELARLVHAIESWFNEGSV